jgi:hypothetical protein
MFNGMIGIVVNSCISGCGFPVNFDFKAVRDWFYEGADPESWRYLSLVWV